MGQSHRMRAARLAMPFRMMIPITLKRHMGYPSIRKIQELMVKTKPATSSPSLQSDNKVPSDQASEPVVRPVMPTSTLTSTQFEFIENKRIEELELLRARCTAPSWLLDDHQEIWEVHCQIRGTKVSTDCMKQLDSHPECQ